MVIYPAGLPLPQLAQQIKNKERTIRTSMVTGSSRARTLTTAKTADCQLSFFFNQTEYNAFIGWFDYELKTIDAWFECPMIREGGVIKENIRFLSEVTESKINGSSWMITASVEIKRSTKVSAIDSMAGLYGLENLNYLAGQLTGSIADYLE